MKLINHTVAMSRREIVKGLAAGSVVVLAPGCAYNEELGRNQLLFVSSGQMAQLASSAWTDLKKTEKTTNDPKYKSRMNRVAPRIITAFGGNPSEWEVQVFASKELNAFALPGNKIGFYTGILDIMENDDQIACVMGHECAHVNYNHSGERYSQSTLAQTGLTVAQVAVSGNRYQNEIIGVLGMGASLGVILPFSRKHELEADKFGLRYMHRAGFNVDQAIVFWQKMSAKKDGAPPEILSTHPSDATRIAQLQREIALIRQGQVS
ncbi:MAG: M48 family metalloprotease [Rhodomicrobium sp.]|nr:M48 family metalloprotease [Rhodomicrobium sp.]